MKYLLLPFFVFFIQEVVAQKLPDVQTKSVFLTKPIKIDGKSADWADSFEAENKRAVIQYTVGNDTKNLYLVMKTASMQNIQKIVNGGVTLSINVEGKRNLKDTYALSYPIPKEFRSTVAGGSFGGSGGGRGGVSSSGGGPVRSVGASGTFTASNGGSNTNRGENVNPAALAARRDSISRVNYKKTLADSKEIKINGFTSIQDSTLSIYNEYGVKVAAAFDQAGHLVYELCVPLSLLALDAARGQEFAYQIRINGLSFPTAAPRSVISGSGSTMAMETVTITYSSFSGGALTEVDMFNPAEFWGKYKLVSK